MTKRMLIDATHHEETRVVVMDGNKLVEFDYESQFRRQLKGNIFLAKVTRVEPSLQAAFVNYGGNRHGFLPFAEIHPDYYRIPVADREALLAEQQALEEEAARLEAEEDARENARHAAQERGEVVTDENGDIEQGENGAIDFVADAPAEMSFTSDDLDAEIAHEIPTEEDIFGDLQPSNPPSVTETDAEDDDSEDDEEESDENDDGEEEGHVHTDDCDHGDEAVDDEHAPELNEAGEPIEHAEGEAQGDGQNNGQNRGRKGGRGWRRRDGKDGGREGGGRDHNRGNGRGGRYMGARKPREEVSEEGPASLHARFRRRYKIQEVIKRGQIMLVQVSKEERGNKGAAVSTYLSLPGRYCVLMPNSPRGGGVSRKIGNFSDRRRLKDMLRALGVPSGMSVILRTAGVERAEAEIKRDYDYLLRLWDNIREMTLQSTAPASIYEEGDLIKRSIRDIYSRDVDELLVSGDAGFKEASEFMSVLMPGHEGKVQQYDDQKIPLFQRYQIESQITEIGEPVVQLKSGGYLVINQTEALVAVDVNSGRATKERHIEETALKTNLEAAEEVARQLRLRDLGGLVVIDFIDMEDRRNNAKVERKLKDALSGDRARIQMTRISTFGLMELSRQRLNPSLTEAQFQKCAHCHGFGFIRSVDSAAILALRALEEEGVRDRSTKIILHVPNEIALYILNEKRTMLATIEKRYGFNVMVHVDESLAPSGHAVEAVKVEVVGSDDEDGEESGEPTSSNTRPQRDNKPPRRKPVMMDQALDETRAPSRAAIMGDDMIDTTEEGPAENFNRPDVEPDGDGARKSNRTRTRGGRNRNRNGRDRNGERGETPHRERNGNVGDAVEGVPLEAPETGDVSTEGNAPRRNNNNRNRNRGGRNRNGPRENADGQAPVEGNTERPQRDNTQRREPREPRNDAAIPAASAAPSGSEVKATYFVAKRRTSNENQNDTAPASAPVSTPVETSSPAPDGSKKKGWWNKF